jgi:N-acetylglucosaminyldiphosphoundecaprenol N-acetyl-beta-D-mannosaminyltransferase
MKKLISLKKLVASAGIILLILWILHPAELYTDIIYQSVIVSLPVSMIETSRIISLNIHNLSFRESLDQITGWGLARQPGFVCFANVHMTIEAHTDPLFSKELDKAALILPDGKPIAMACRWLYNKKQERISGMDFMPALLQEAHNLKARLFLYGSTEEVLAKISEKIRSSWPGVVIAGAISPPFRKLSDKEISEHIHTMNQSATNFVLVALGCPKQEKWMAQHFPSVNAIMLGLGGAFPVMAGIQKRAPHWMQRFALEWLFRLIQEPGRMFKRYFYTNSYFMWLLLKHLIKNIFSAGRQTKSSSAKQNI